MGVQLSLIVLAAFTFVAFASGCGGGSGPTSATRSEAGTVSTTKAQFVTSANGICVTERKGGDWRGKAYRRKHRSEGLPEAVMEENTRKGVLLLTEEAEISSIGALPVPAGDEERIGDILRTLEVAVRDARRKATTAREAAEFLARANEDLRAYGLASCVRGE